MNQNLLDGFKQGFDNEVAKFDKFIIDNHNLVDGLYIKINIQRDADSMRLADEPFEHLDIVNPKDKDKKNPAKQVNKSNLYKWFRERDYYSNYVESNKAVGKDLNLRKKISSNNYLSWFVKKDHIIFIPDPKKSDKDNEEKKIKNSWIEFDKIVKANIDYYNALDESDNNSAFNSPDVLDLLNKTRPFNKVRFDFARYIMTDEFQRIFDYILGTSKKRGAQYQVKIFFDFDIEDYKREGSRYLYHRSLDGKKKETLNNVDYGIPGFNINSSEGKKLALFHPQRINNVPYFTSQIDAVWLHKLSLYYDIQYKKGASEYYYQHMPEALALNLKDEYYSADLESTLDGDKCRNLIKLRKSKSGIELADYDVVTVPNFEFALNKKYQMTNYLNARICKNGTYILKEYSSKVSDDSRGFYKANEERLILFNNVKTDIWEYFKKELFANEHNKNKYKDHPSYSLLKRFSDKMDFDSLKLFMKKYGLLMFTEAIKAYPVAKTERAKDTFNLYFSIKNFINQEEEMETNTVIECQKLLIEKMETGDAFELESKEEYLFAAGQLLRYFSKKSKSSNLKHDIVIPFLSKKSTQSINKLLENKFKNAAHDIFFDFSAFKRLYFAVVSFPPEKISDNSYFMGGYLSDTIIKKIDNKTKSNKEGEE